MSGADVIARAAAILGHRAEQGVELAPFTTFRIGGPASLVVHARNADDFAAVHDAVRSTGVDVLVIGQGSNLLIADAGWPGLVVVVGGGDSDAIAIEHTEEHEFAVRAGAGVKLPVLARRSVVEGATGLEWMVGVPGSVGGAVRMNAGGHGSDIATNIVSANVVDLADDVGIVRRSPASLGFAYRHSALSSSEVVINATFRCGVGPSSVGEETVREIVRWRRVHQPGGANCGSVFTNPPGDSAGRLIDAAGLKGRRIGGASVSDKHANFIQSDPGGSAADVWALITHVRTQVFERWGEVLTPEVRTAGFDAELPVLVPLASADADRDADGDANRDASGTPAPTDAPAAHPDKNP